MFSFNCRDGKLSKGEFFHMMKYLFCRKGVSYKLTKKNEQELFKLLDENQVSNLQLSFLVDLIRDSRMIHDSPHSHESEISVIDLEEICFKSFGFFLRFKYLFKFEFIYL